MADLAYRAMMFARQVHANQLRDHMEKCNRYVHAVDDLDKWCGHQSPHARLIARHLRAVGEGFSHRPCAEHGY